MSASSLARLTPQSIGEAMASVAQPKSSSAAGGYRVAGLELPSLPNLQLPSLSLPSVQLPNVPLPNVPLPSRAQVEGATSFPGAENGVSAVPADKEGDLLHVARMFFGWEASEGSAEQPKGARWTTHGCPAARNNTRDHTTP